MWQTPVIVLTAFRTNCGEILRRKTIMNDINLMVRGKRWQICNCQEVEKNTVAYLSVSSFVTVLRYSKETNGSTKVNIETNGMQKWKIIEVKYLQCKPVVSTLTFNIVNSYEVNSKLPAIWDPTLKTLALLAPYSVPCDMQTLIVHSLKPS